MAEDRPGVCGVLWKMETENSLWGSILCQWTAILILHIFKLDVKWHSKGLRMKDTREKNNKQPLSLRSLKLRWRSHKFMNRQTGQHRQCMKPKWGWKQEVPQGMRMSVLGAQHTINHWLWFSYRRQQKGLIICCDEVIRKGITEKAE